MAARAKKIALAAALVAITVLPLTLLSRVKDTPHNLHGTNGVVVPHQEVCRPCHTPHNADPTISQYLWNHALSDPTWTLWENSDPASVADGTSRLCLSCHDGTVALDAFGGFGGTPGLTLSGSVNLGTDLTVHHPIGVDYPEENTFGYNTPDADGNIVDIDETPPGSSAHLEDGRVQCVSCHFAHGSRAPYGMFLRVDNTGSALCMTCHRTPG